MSEQQTQELDARITTLEGQIPDLHAKLNDLEALLRRLVDGTEDHR